MFCSAEEPLEIRHFRGLRLRGACAAFALAFAATANCQEGKLESLLSASSTQEQKLGTPQSPTGAGNQTRATIRTQTDALVEGFFRGATADEVIMEIAGQPLRLPLRNGQVHLIRRGTGTHPVLNSRYAPAFD